MRGDNMKIKNLILLPALLMLLACGGSSTPGAASDAAASSESAPISSNAIAMAVAVSDAGGDVGHMSTIFDVTTTPQVKAINQALNDGLMTFTLTDHEMAEKNGSGTFVVNGAASLSVSSKVQATLNASGNLDVQLKDVTKTADVGGTTYTAIINGKLKITFSGTEMPTDVNKTQVYSDITYTITGSDLAITGTTTGTITDLNAVREMKVMMVDGVAQRVSTCSGTVTVKTDAGTSTCTYQSDCSKCS